MADTIQTVTATTRTDAPAFLGSRWNGWAVFALAILCIGCFILVQTAGFIIVFLHQHPEILRQRILPAQLQNELRDPNFLTNLLTAKNLWLMSVTSEVTLALATLFLARMAFGASSRSLGVGVPPNAAQLRTGALVGAVLFVASAVVVSIQTHFFGPHPQPQALALTKHHGAFDFVLDLMSICIIAPLAEEIFFRGFVFAGLAQRMAPMYAIGISALIFGLAHWERWSFLPIFLIGLGLAWLYYRTQTLWPNILAHATVNTISLVIAFVAPQFVKS